MSENPYEKYYSNIGSNPEDLCDDSFDASADNLYKEDASPVNDDGFAELCTKPSASDTDFQPYGCGVPDDNCSVPSGDCSPVCDENKNLDNTVSYEWNGNAAPVAVTPQINQNVQFPYYDNNSKAKRKQKSKTPLALILLLCMMISTVFGGGSAFLVNYLNNRKLHSDSSLIIHQISPGSQNGDYSTAGELSTVEIVDKYADSVVEIITESVTTGVFSQQYIESGAGSGVIIDSKGYIVTNHHVIEGARKISVTLRNGKTYSAQLIGSDSKVDLALLKIEAQNLTAAVFGDSDTLKVGQRTIAIGNPLGQLGGTVTEGIISALDRELVVDGQSMNLLQTDTAINPGNSGGGMFDAKGNLIGVVVAKSSGSEVEGLGFAIPINDAISAISDLMDYGYVRGRVDIGIEFIDVSSEAVAWMYGLSETGCYVYRVEHGSNAETAGFRSGDLVFKVDGKDVSTSDEIEKILEEKNVGDKVEFSIKRGSSTGKVTLELEEYIPDTIKNPSNENDDLIEWYNFD